MALTGDEISRLYAEHSAALLRHMARQTWDPELAVDLVGETFARAFEQRARFRGGNAAAARAWIYEIARHLLIDVARRGQVERAALTRLGVSRRPLSNEEFDRVEELATSTFERSEIAERFAALPEDQRTAVRLRVVDERSYDVVADALGVSEQTARARVSRGLRALRALSTAAEAPEHA